MDFHTRKVKGMQPFLFIQRKQVIYFIRLENLSFRGCLNFARQINQIDFLGKFQPS